MRRNEASIVDLQVVFVIGTLGSSIWSIDASAVALVCRGFEASRAKVSVLLEDVSSRSFRRPEDIDGSGMYDLFPPPGAKPSFYLRVSSPHDLISLYS